MSRQKSSFAQQFLDVETLQELRSRAKLYKKLDLAYLAAGGAIVTALKLNSYTLVEFAAELWFVGVAIMLIFSFDTVIEQRLLIEWISTKEKPRKKRSIPTLTTAAHLQPYIHLFFICAVISISIGYSTGVTRVRETFRAQAAVQSEVDLFISKKGRRPVSIDEVVAASPRTARWQETLQNQPIAIESMGKTGYRLIFSGDDKSFGTDDDFVLNSDVKLMNILDCMEAAERGNQSVSCR